MSGGRLIELHLVQDVLPVSLASIYSQTCRGNWAWATRTGPDGRRGRRLWVDLDALAAWSHARGWRLNLPAAATQPRGHGQGV